MKKLIIALVAIMLPSLALAWDQRPNQDPKVCKAFMPYGEIVASGKHDTTPLCRQGYFIMHDNAAKIPLWAAWNITPEHVNGCVKRTNAFVADAALPADKRSTPSDYAGSGYDQGHIANDAHQSWDQQVEYESFLMSNMSPQLPGLNRGIWKLLETSTGAWTFSRKHTLVIYAGDVYTVGKDKTIGNNKVTVPNKLWKVVIDTQTNEVLAFLFPQAENQGNDLTKVQVTIADLEAATGLSIPVPPGTNKLNKPPLWPVDFKAVAENKKAICKGWKPEDDQ
jgi:endonuclease G